MAAFVTSACRPSPSWSRDAFETTKRCAEGGNRKHSREAEQQQTGSIRDQREPADEQGRTPKCADAGERDSGGTIPQGLSGVTETAIAEALALAARAGQWSTVDLLAKELEACRHSRQGAQPGEVVELAARAVTK